MGRVPWRNRYRQGTVAYGIIMTNGYKTAAGCFGVIMGQSLLPAPYDSDQVTCSIEIRCESGGLSL